MATGEYSYITKITGIGNSGSSYSNAIPTSWNGGTEIDDYILSNTIENPGATVFIAAFDSEGIGRLGNAEYLGTANGWPVVTCDLGDGITYYVISNEPIPASGSINPVQFVICFVKGTKIATPSGLIPIENLSMSDLVLGADGSHIEIKWIGKQTIPPISGTLTGNLPVKISANAIDERVPSQDLYVSPDHAVLIEGHLVHAIALVNGSTITQATEWDDDIVYCHIETEQHEIIIAEGLPVETFIDNVSRDRFDNVEEYKALYPNGTKMEELDLPRVKFQRQLPKQIRLKLEARAGMSTVDYELNHIPLIPTDNLLNL